MKKLNVGDKVAIRKDLVVDRLYDDICFVDGMVKYKGKEAIITNIDENIYTINLDKTSWKWNWSIEMFEPVKTAKKSTIKTNNKYNVISMTGGRSSGKTLQSKVLFTKDYISKDFITREEFEEFKKQVENNKVVEIPKIEEKPTRFRAKDGEIYWHIDSWGNVVSCQERHDSADDFRYNTKNYYETEEEAKRALDIMNILNKYSYEFSKEEVEDTDILKNSIHICVEAKKLGIDSHMYFINNTRLFKNCFDCRHAIDEIGYDDYIKYCIMGGIK